MSCEDGEGDRGAQVEGVGGCGGAEEAFQECQVSNHNADCDGFPANSPPAIFPPGGIMSVMIRVGICHSQISTIHTDNKERHV